MTDPILLPTQELPGTLDALEPLAEFIKAASAQAGLTAKQAYGLRLAMDEVATNIATHGYAEQGLQGGIRVRGRMTADELILELEDSAPAFDPRTLLDRSARILKNRMEDKQVGGLGIFLAIKALHRFEYRRSDEHNHNIFVMKRPAAST